MNGPRKMSAESEDGLRVVPEFGTAVDLLAEKTALQTRLREVDKLLRKMDLLHPGLCVVARRDLDLPVGEASDKPAASKRPAI